MNAIEWKIGHEYIVGDIMSQNKAILEGFIVNQCPIEWKDQTSYCNHADHTVWFVLSFSRNGGAGKKRFLLAKPEISNYIPEVSHGDAIYSQISLYGREYGDSPEELIKKLRQNFVFTKELSYDAKYKEGFKQND